MDLRRVNQELLVQTEELLHNEATEDAQFRSLKNRDALFCGGILFLFCFHQIESALPTLASLIMSLDANEDAIVGALKQSLICIFFLNLLFFKIIWCCIVELTFPFPR
jgi:programmed cell death 6-interacting protein